MRPPHPAAKAAGEVSRNYFREDRGNNPTEPAADNHATTLTVREGVVLGERHVDQVSHEKTTQAAGKSRIHRLFHEAWPLVSISYAT